MQPASAGADVGPQNRSIVPPCTGFRDRRLPGAWTAERECPPLPITIGPESAMVHFYTSRIRGDTDYTDVLPEEKKRSSKLKAALKKTDSWKFVDFKLVSRKKLSKTSYRIKFKYTAIVKGKTKQKTVEAKVEQKDTAWVVTKIPS